MILCLAFQSIGIAYGDIGTSPLYVYASTFAKGIHHEDDILGVLSLILYTLTLIPLVKYVFIALKANDNGDGKIRFFLGQIYYKFGHFSYFTKVSIHIFTNYFVTSYSITLSTRWDICIVLSHLPICQCWFDSKQPSRGRGGLKFPA